MSQYQQGTPIEIEDTFTVGGVLTTPNNVTYSILGPNGVTSTYVYPGNPAITNPSTGVLILALDPPAYAGTYIYDVDSTGVVVGSRTGTFDVISNNVVPPDVPWAVDGPCSPWCDAQDLWAQCGSPTEEIYEEGTGTTICPVDMTPYAMMGSWLLWTLEGRLHTGRCTRTIRPCSARPCGFQILSRGHIVWPDYNNFWGGYGWNGWDWRFENWEGGCGCTPMDRINLAGYPVREILTVKIDGVVLPEFDPSTGFRNWRLDNRRFLTRMDDSNGNAVRWPACQHLAADDTQPGTFSVEYAYGQDPPMLGSLAAAQIGCELYRNSHGDDCMLPNGTIRVTRQGITIDKMATLGWFKNSSHRWGPQARWQTGLPLVDAYLNAVNPFGNYRRPMMMAAGTKRTRYAQSVGQT